MTSFDRAIAVEPAGDGVFGGNIDLDWSAPLGPNGGYIAALAVRAFEAVLAPEGERTIRSLTCHYLRPPGAGEIELRVEQVRAGRRMATGRLSGYQHGKEVLAAIAAFSSPGIEGVAEWAPLRPDVPPPPAIDDEILPPDEWRGRGWLGYVEGAPALMQHLLIAPRIGGRPYSGRPVEPGRAPRAGGWVALGEERMIDSAWVALCTDVWWPPSLEPLDRPSGAPTIDLTIHFRADLPPEGLPYQPLLAVFESTAALGGMVEEDGVVFTEDGTLLAQSRQLALLTPLG